MKNKRINLVAALTFGVLALAGSSVSAQTFPATENAIDDVEIITIQDESSKVESIFNENVLNVNCGCDNSIPKAVSPRVRMSQDDCGCETGAALPPPCPEPCPCEPVNPCAEPCDVSPACPVEDPCADPCDDPCDVSPACPISSPCPAVPSGEGLPPV